MSGFVSAGAILAGIKHSIDYTTELSDISRELNVNISLVDAWGRALQRTGGNAQSFKSTLQGLSTRYGATPDQALKLLPTFADAFSKMSKSQALIRGKQFGFDVPTILLLQQGRREVEELIKRQERLGVVTEQDKEQTMKFNYALADLSQVFLSFSRELARPLIPGFTKVLNYLIEHKDALEGGLIAIGIAAAALSAPFLLANSAIIAITASIGLLIAAFAVIFEDIKRFKEGLPSLIGDIKIKVKHTTDKLPDFIQKIIGTKAPDYALPNTHAPYRNGLGESNIHHQNTVHIGVIKVETQSTDANGIAVDIGASLKSQIYQLITHVDNGIAI